MVVAAAPAPVASDAFHVIGKGRMGTFLAQALGGADGRSYGRQDSVATMTGRAIVATRTGDLDEVLAALPAGVKADLVLVQNGIYAETLRRHHVTEATQLVAYFAITRVGESPHDKVGMSVVTGKYGQELRQGLAAYGVKVRVVSPEEWWVVAHEKLIWLSIFGLLGTAYELSVGELITPYASEISRLTFELCGVCQEQLGIRFAGGAPGVLQRQLEYAQSIRSFVARLKGSEYPYRNGYFVAMQPTLLHLKLLAQVQQLGGAGRMG